MSNDQKDFEGREGSALEVLKLAGRLGLTAFGGPAAHIAILEDEVVRRRGWISSERFVRLYGLTNLLPGPNSTEMVMHLGQVRAGFRGLLAAGLGFILPASTIVLGLAVLYDRYGATTAGERFLFGVQATVIAILIQVIWRLQKSSVTGVLDIVTIITLAALYVFGLPEIVLLFLGGFGVWCVRRASERLGENRLLSVGPMLVALPATIAAAGGEPFSQFKLFWSFLKIGALLYGSGYVLFAFLNGEFVEELGWLTEQQLLDAVAVGQVTPGPLFSTATFVGYLAGGLTGAVVATVAIFLPAFCFVALAAPLLVRIERHPGLLQLLDAISLAALGLLVGITWTLATVAISDPAAALIAFVAIAVLGLFRINASLVVIAGGLAGALIKSIGF